MYCHHCQWEFSVPEDSIGTVVECPHCAARITVENRTMVLPCPECKTSLRVDLWMIGELAECPTCGKEIKLHCVSAPPETQIGFKEYHKPIPGASCQQGEILGKYQICRCLGVGGMGEVYLARHTVMETFCALKLLKPEVAARNRVLPERLIREAKIAAKLQHPNIITVFDACIDPENNRSFIVMEYVDGSTVEEMLKEGPLPEEQVLEIAKSVTSALVAASRIGIVHRDIKPANIMITKQGIIKLADLGIAKGDSDTVGVTLTQENTVLGTPNYASPEQLRSSHSVDARADVYSLGATMYHMLSGIMPFAGDTVFNVMAKVLEDTLPPLEECGRNISPMTRQLVERMLSKDPADRPANAVELLSELRSIDPNKLTVSGKIKKLRKQKQSKQQSDGEKTGGFRKSMIQTLRLGAVILVVILLGFAVKIVSNFYQAQEMEKANLLRINRGSLLAVIDRNSLEKITEFAEKYRGPSREKVYHMLAVEAIRQQNIPLLEQMLKQGLIPPVSKFDGIDFSSVIISTGNEEMLRLFLDNGLSVNSRNNHGVLLLFQVAHNKQMLKLLLSKKDCDVKVRDATGKTALFYVLKDPQSVQLLLDAGCDANAIEDKEGENVIFATVSSFTFPPGAEVILKAGINLEQKNRWGETALEKACRFHRREHIKALLDAGAKPTQEAIDLIQGFRRLPIWQEVFLKLDKLSLQLSDDAAKTATAQPAVTQRETSPQTAVQRPQPPAVSAPAPQAVLRSLNERLDYAEQQLAQIPEKLKQAQEIKDTKPRDKRVEFLLQRRQFLRRQIRELQALQKDRERRKNMPEPVYDQAAGEEFKRRILEYTAQRGLNFRTEHELSTFFAQKNIDPDIIVADSISPNNNGPLIKMIAKGRLRYVDAMITAWSERNPSFEGVGLPPYINKPSLLEKLLQLPFDYINLRTYYDVPLLLHKIRYPSLSGKKIVTRLLLLGANPDIPTSTGNQRAALHLEAARDNAEAVRELLLAGADPNIKDADGRTPVFYAVISGNFSAIQPLLAAGADADVVDKYGKKALDYKLQGQFSIAVKNEKLSEIRSLLRQGANINMPSLDGFTPLQYACQKNKSNIIRILLEAGANPNYVPNTNRGVYDASPLQIAYRNLPESMLSFQQLIRHGANTAVPFQYGNTPLLATTLNRNDYFFRHKKMSDTNYRQIIQLLISGYPQLSAAQQKQCFEAALNQKSEMYLQRMWAMRSGWPMESSFLTQAIRNNCSENTIKWLLEQGAKPTPFIINMVRDDNIKRLMQRYSAR